MKERLVEFLKAENKSSAQLAEEIGVQPSGISHILSGRNNPSLDFVLKMLEKYQYISTDWLLFGKGSMYKDLQMKTLFDDMNDTDLNREMLSNEKTAGTSDKVLKDLEKNQDGSDSEKYESDKTTSVKRIVWFFSDNSFKEYFPRL